MKIMKRLSILLATAALFAAITGCQKEPVGTENVESAKAYAQLNISFATTNTKADPTVDDTDLKDAGEKSEYEVKSATLYFVQDTKVKMIETLIGNFTERVDGNDVYYTHIVDELIPGTYNVYVTVNKVLDGISVDTPEATLQASIQGNNTDPLFGRTIPASGMPMSSRNPSANFEANAANAGLYQTVTIATTNTKDNPCPISLDIERSMARIAYKVTNANNEYIVYEKRQGSGSQMATVTLKQFKVLNQTKQWYAFRRVCSYDSGWVDKGFGLISTGYLWDPNIQQKNSDTAANADNYVFDGTTTDISVNTVGATEVLAYSYENAVHQNNQLAGYVTTIRFVGKITPATDHLWYLDGSSNLKNDVAYIANNDLFYYDNHFYTSLDALNARTHLGVSTSNYKDFNVKFYDDGTCYYDYYIKHLDNKVTPNMGIMEYAIVRNNSYQVSVTQILSTGNDDEDDVAASTPVEQQQTYFQVKLTIRPWVVRAQQAVLG